MADTPTGVSDRSSSGSSRTEGNSSPSTPAKSQSFFQKNKKPLLIIGGGAGFLLLSSKGNKGTASSPANQQAAIDAAVAQQALSDAQANPGSYPVDTGAGITGGTDTSGSSTGSGSGTTIDTSGSDGSLDSGTTSTPSGTDSTGSSTVSPNTPNNPGNAPAPNEAPTSKHKAASKRGKTNHRNAGAKTQNPHNTQQHTGGGVTVHGRTFPGAVSHTVHPPTKVGNDVHRKVTVNYGGHSATHVSVNHGKTWIDNAKGSTPPSRGPAVTRGHLTGPVTKQPALPKPAVVNVSSQSGSTKPGSAAPSRPSASHPAPTPVRKPAGKKAPARR